MSQTLAMVCNDCETYMCVGQSSNTLGWFVYGQEDDLKKLSAFVDKHIGHAITFKDLDAVTFGFQDEDPDGLDES